ncbi:MAG: response regulator [Pseudomonadota bacterium]
MAGEKTQFLTPNQVAELLMVSPITVRQWAQKGMLAAHTTAGGHRRFTRAEVERFALERGVVLADQQEAPASADNAAQRKVLVVDDDQQLNSYLVALLQTSVDDIEVFSALDGFAAGRLVQEHKPQLVVLDIMMPGIDGVQVCRSIKDNEQTAHALVVAMTGHYSEQLEHRVREAGAAVLLKKPFAAEELFEHCGFSPLHTNKS